MTKKQRELLNFIDQFIRQYGYAPSYREVMTSLGYRSVSTVATHVENLIMLGYLEKKDHSARSLRVVGKDVEPVREQRVTSAQEKWLIDKVTTKFDEVENSKAPTQKQVDALFVLVGALHVLGFQEAVISFKARLKEIKEKVRIDV